VRTTALLACAAFVVLLVPGGLHSQAPATPPRDFDAVPFAPRQYVCYRAPAGLIIDGRMSEPAWQAAAWTDPFIDIEGDVRPKPRFRTRAKMLWDDHHFYVAAEMQEPDVWATLTKYDSVVYADNDFEVFIDPDGDTHTYAEIEINAFKTVWDLMLVRPYRDGGPAITAWNIPALLAAVDVRGTLNRPGDRDEGWTVELALPWRDLGETAASEHPPQPGEQWRVNFSRVAWQVDAREERYTKRLDPVTGKPLPADNWVWSPQGAVDMHMPERWGYVQFSGADAGTGTDAFVEDPNERVKWALRRLYYRQRRFRATNGRYADDLAALGQGDIHVEGFAFAPSMQATRELYEISAKGFGGVTMHIRQDGRAWTTRQGSGLTR